MTVSTDGLWRVAELALKKHHPETPEEAEKFIRRQLGAYSDDNRWMEQAVTDYFSGRH